MAIPGRSTLTNNIQQTSGIDIPEEEFQKATAPKDLRGRINLRVDFALQQEIENIAEDKRYPLDSVSEVVRYCCLLGLERLRQWVPRKTLLGSIKAASALIVQDRLQCDIDDILSKLDERVEWHIQHGTYDEIIDLAARIRGQFENIDGFWAERARDEIDRKFVIWLGVIDELKKSKK